MIYAAYVLLILFCAAGFLAIIFTGFGTLLIFLGAVLFAVMTHFAILNFWILGVLLLFFICGEVLDYVAVAAGAKKLGASNAAVIGAALGGILGALAGSFFAGAGLLPGALAGIFCGAFLLEYIFKRDWKQSLKSGIGGLLGSAGAVVLKLVIAFGMIGAIAAGILGAQ
jgi:uncharacterized protein YqgC (DUF456 family)